MMSTGVTQRVRYTLLAIGLSTALLTGAQAEDEPPTPAPPAQEEPGPPAEAGTIQERGILDKLPGAATKNFPQAQYQAPTANLTLVANALRLAHKSISTLVTAAPNLPVTQPVEISIGYYSSVGNQRITGSYVRSSGNRFLYNDKEGDGKPRTMTINISLREPKTGGGYETFAVNWQVNLDPQYDVSIGPFVFDLISKCDAVGKSEILFTWFSPDLQYHKFKFSTRAGSRTTISPFAWTRQEVGWSHQLFREKAEFYDEDNAVTEALWNCLPAACGFRGNPVRPTQHLLTGTTAIVKGNLKAVNDNCQAYFEYEMTKTLHLYPYLEP
ncbi:MAG: hypothetical protein ABI856_20315 [Nitrospira sp.]